MYSARTFNMVLRNHYTHVYMYCIERSVYISITRITRVKTYAFVMLLLAMISVHMLTFRLMVTMVAEFCSLVFLIHNTLLGEITISSTRTTRVNYTSIPQYVMIHLHMQRFNFIDLMVIELRFFKKKKKNKKMKNMGKNVKCTFVILRISYITDQPIFVSWLFFTRSSP